MLLVVDLSRLTFMDAWALHVILAADRNLRDAGSALAPARRRPAAGTERS